MCVLVQGDRCSKCGRRCRRFDISVSEAQTGELIVGQQVRVGGDRALILKATGRGGRLEHLLGALLVGPIGVLTVEVWYLYR